MSDAAPPTEAPKRSGWAYPTASARRAHFIDEARSLCGNWGYLGSSWLDLRGLGRMDERCKACASRLNS